MTKETKLRQEGFSLLELSVVLMILSIVASGLLTLGTAKMQQNQLENSYEEMEEIQTALKVYLNEYGKLPCPASITLAAGNALYGREATDCTDATPPAGLTRVEYPAASGKYVRIGGVPFYSLGLPERYLGDYYNNRYVYAVMESAIPSFASSSVGNIQILDNAGTAITAEAVAVLVSPGRSHRGAYNTRGGALYSACNTTNKDGENCDADGVFTDAVFNDGATAASFYDDLILWNTRMTMFEAVATGGSTSGGSTSSSSSSSTSSGGYQRIYTMEYKGLTPVYARNLGTSYYDAQCNTLYPGSWMLRSSNFVNIETMPAIPAAPTAHLHIDACTYYPHGVGACTFEPTLPRTGQITAFSGFSNTEWNCGGNWTSVGWIGPASFQKSSSSATPIRYTDLSGGGVVVANSATTGIVTFGGSCTAGTGVFICVGYKPGFEP